ncbi:MAG: hypothetical protein K2Q32_02255 [Alphaproteobacteria bacterium]|nr:hypothetical protein [Alphaproteobacteria bacterium]
MLRGAGFLAITLLVLGLLCENTALAQTTPPANPPANPPPASTTIKCNFDEYPAKENGSTVCRKVPTCKSDEVNSYDTASQKFICKRILKCDPKHQQAAYINGKNVCIDIPNCDGPGKHYAFDGTKMICQ